MDLMKLARLLVLSNTATDDCSYYLVSADINETQQTIISPALACQSQNDNN